jgi:hypothetical protein
MVLVIFIMLSRKAKDALKSRPYTELGRHVGLPLQKSNLDPGPKTARVTKRENGNPGSMFSQNPDP